MRFGIERGIYKSFKPVTELRIGASAMNDSGKISHLFTAVFRALGGHSSPFIPTE
jgi:hypothetical protein